MDFCIYCGNKLAKILSKKGIRKPKAKGIAVLELLGFAQAPEHVRKKMTEDVDYILNEQKRSNPALSMIAWGTDSWYINGKDADKLVRTSMKIMASIEKKPYVQPFFKPIIAADWGIPKATVKRPYDTTSIIAIRLTGKYERPRPYRIVITETITDRITDQEILSRCTNERIICAPEYHTSFKVFDIKWR